MSSPLLARLIEKRTETKSEFDALTGKVDAEERTALTTDETVKFDALRGELSDLDARISDLKDQETRDGKAAELRVDTGTKAAPAVVRSEPMTYTAEKSVGENISYFRDLWNMKQHGDTDAMARLNRHAKEMDVELPARAEKRAARSETEVRNQIGWDAPSPFEKRVNPNRTDGQGGYLVPPLWMMDGLVKVLRAGRVVADQVRHFDLPEGTDSINIPKLATGTTTAIQTADAAAVSSTDFNDTSISAGVKTIAGQQDVSIQLVEQSPLSLDQILFEDLIADYNQKLDAQVIGGSNANGQVQGLYSSAGASSWTSYNQITNSTATVPGNWPLFAQSLSKIAQTRYDVSNVKFFLHPRRWFSIAGGLDTTNRPLIVPSGQNAYNAMGEDSVSAAQGYVGNLILGNPVFIDANITTADTAGGSAQDIVLALKSDDAFLFEGQLRQRTLPEVLSGTLQVRFQVYNYVAFLLRYGQSLAITSGTGLAAPSGY